MKTENWGKKLQIVLGWQKVYKDHLKGNKSYMTNTWRKTKQINEKYKHRKTLFDPTKKKSKTLYYSKLI